MMTRDEFKKNPELVFDKTYGSLSGLAIGDSFGDSFGDASRKQENRENYAITTDFNSKASWSTDNTEFALLTAKTLIRCGGQLTTDEVVKSWLEDVAVQDEFKRGGANEIEAANNLRRGLRPPMSGKYNSFHMSDGSAMRIGPIGAVAGTILGAKYGAKGIPENWTDKTRFPTGTCLDFAKGVDIRDYAEKLSQIIIL